MSVEAKFEEIRGYVLTPLENYLDGKDATFRKEDYAIVSGMVYEVASGINADENLYRLLENAVKSYYSQKLNLSLKALKGSELLNAFNLHGKNQELMMRFYKNQFDYLGRNYIKRAKKPSFEQIIKNEFQQIIYEGIKQEISITVLEMINQERDGQMIDRELVQETLRFVSSLGTRVLKCYCDDFEKHFLTQSRLYYSGKSNIWLASDSVAEFLRRADHILLTEKRRVHALLHHSTDPKLAQVLEKELLKDKVLPLMERENTGLRYMFQHDKLEDIALFYKFVVRIGQGSEEMAKMFRQHIIEVADLELKKRRMREDSHSRDKGDITDDSELILSLVELNKKYLEMVKQQFNVHPRFQEALKRAMNITINSDLVKHKVVEVLATFVDKLLRSGRGGSAERRSDQELENLLNESVMLFAFVNDKDIFKALYREKLASRLMNQTSSSADHESLMISKLKLQCGQEFTGNFEGMMYDISNSKEADKAFEEVYAKQLADHTGGIKLIPELSIQVLTLGNWPTYQSFDKVDLPREMKDAMSLFQAYYLTRNDGKRLVWIHELGSVFVKATFGKKAYTMQVAPLQAVVLMYFHSMIANEGGAITPQPFERIQEAILLEEDPLKRVLDSLVFGKQKILNRARPMTVPKDRAIVTSDIFSVNGDFTSKVLKFKVSMPSLTNLKTTEKVEEDRKFAIEACVVRIMKARKLLQHTALISEVLTQLQLFKPNPQFVRKVIESLIERDYLERDESDRNTYKYVAEVR